MLSFKKLLIKNTTWLAIGDIFSMAILFVITIIIARSLGDVAYGQFAFILAFAQLWQVLAEFGLSIIATREMTNHKHDLQKFLNNFLSLKLIISIITFVLIIITVQFINKPPLIKNLIYIAGGYIVFYTFTEFLRSVFRAYEKFKFEAFIKISQHIILFVLIVNAIYNHSLTQATYAYFWSAVYSTAITLVVIYKKFTHFRLAWDKKLIIYLLKESWPMALANMFVIVYFRIDTVMLSLIKGDQPTGWYNVAYLLIYSLSFIPYTIMNSIYPKLSQLAKTSLEQTRYIYRRSLLLIAVGGFIILGIANLIIKPAIIFFYGNEFTPAIQIFYILTLAVWFAYLSHVWLYTLNALGKQTFYTLATAIGMLINLWLNLKWIPAYSYTGAAWATVITEMIIALIIMIATEITIHSSSIKRREMPLPTPEKPFK